MLKFCTENVPRFVITGICILFLRHDFADFDGDYGKSYRQLLCGGRQTNVRQMLSIRLRPG